MGAWCTTLDQAQAGFDQLAAKLAGGRRTREGEPTTVGGLAAGEGLRPAPPVAFPAESDLTRTAGGATVVVHHQPVSCRRARSSRGGGNDRARAQNIPRSRRLMRNSVSGRRRSGTG